jgi:Holliday junction resolvase RusA-like endonuclease
MPYRKGKTAMDFTLETIIPTLNEYSGYERTHRHRAAQVKKICEASLAIEMRAQHRKPITDYPVNISYHWYVRNRRTDKSNIAFGQKFVEDALQKAGILRNDGWSEIESFTHSFSVDESNPRLEIKLTKATI